MKSRKYLRLLKEGTPIDVLLDLLASDGFCPNLLNDDGGHWAVAFDGYQTVPEVDGEPSNIATTFFVTKDCWKDTIHEAVRHALKYL